MPPLRQPHLNTPLAKIPGFEGHLQHGTPAVQKLAPADLNDLALRLRGQNVDNPKVTALTFKDVESLEAVFNAQKAAGMGALRPGATHSEVTCCCCTPCCCCT